MRRSRSVLQSKMYWQIILTIFVLLDSNWNMECWIKGKLDLLVCSLRFLKLYLRADLKVNLFYAVSELSLGDVSTSSLKGTVVVAQCDCSDYDECECSVPSPRLNYTYIMWLKMTIGVTPLWSPLMSVKPIDIVKPEPPLNLHLEMAEKGQLKICWSAPVLMPYPLQYEVRISLSSGENAWQMVRFALETSLAIDNALLDSSPLVQVRCRNHRAPGLWSDWSTPYNLGAEVLYFPPKILTSVGSNVSFHCIYKNKTKIVVSKKIVWWLNLVEEIPESQYTLVNDRPIFLLSGYTMWIEFKHFLGTLESSPTCVVPADVVKPLPPSNVKAEITRNVGLLNVSWTNPVFTNNELKFQIRYAVNRKEITWELYEVSNAPRSVVIKVQKLCVEYVVQVRCRELDGPGYWSNWSRPAYTLVQDIKAPLQGPEFWRIVIEDPARRQKNVTLLWKPETFEHLFIKHREALSFEPLLLEPEIVLEDISVTKALKKEDMQDFLVIDSMFTKIQDSERDSACSSSHFNSSSFSESSHDDQISREMTRQSHIKYATLISNCRSSGLYEQKLNLRSLFDSCFPAEGPLVTDAFSSSSWEVGNGAFLVLPDPPGKTLSLSLISSEGFSEPSDQDDTFTDGDSPERSLCYLGITSLGKRENDVFLTESSGVMCQLHTTDLLQDVGFLQHTPPNFNAFIQSSLKYKAIVPYVPQFQMTAAKVQETTEKNS
ncbi:leptin receptor [Limosa lapponica baueri]|uniref:Leptin receptor n=1 Tax=Limosa lapponica baueri TaxID=1758121 RepID=A0A2I0TLE2_LIMLA|nr:leptin receptor [Limosa lapponica baueri]